jgi:hypothetical protein
MFKYLFNGVIYSADTIETLQSLLTKAGYKGNVIAEFEAINKENEEQDQAAKDYLKKEAEDFSSKEEALEESSNDLNQKEIDEFFNQTAVDVEENSDGTFSVVTEKSFNDLN